MKSHIKVTQSKLYRKYLIDPHNFLIKRGKLNKTLKYILCKVFIILKKKQNLKKRRVKKKIFRIKRRIKAKTNLKIFSWKKNFWKNFKIYLSKKNLKKKKLRKLIRIKMKRVYKRIRIYRSMYSRGILKKRISKRRAIVRNVLYGLVRNSNFKFRRSRKLTWLKAFYFGKKRKTWWLLRETKKKTALYYGILKLKKFRFINELCFKKMALPAFYNIKLECMINICLLRLNLLDSLFQINNLIKKTKIIEINGVVCFYPYRVLKTNDSIIIAKFYFKKMFYIFLKRSKFNKSALLKNNKQRKGVKKKRIIRNVINVPKWIEYNYKIMYFTLWRLPKLHEIKSYGYGYRGNTLFDWAIDTKLKYNNS